MRHKVVGRRRRLTQAWLDSDFRDRKKTWRDWYMHNFIFNVVHAQQLLQSAASAEHANIRRLLQGTSEAPITKKLWQCRCAEALRLQDIDLLYRHVRRRLERWSLAILPGHRARRMDTALARIAKLVPPCVWAAALKALMGGWATAEASGKGGGCLFGCSSGQDGLPHYATCPTACRLARSRLHILPAPPERRLQAFLLLDEQGIPEQLAIRALHLHAVFVATNAGRHGRAANAADAWEQARRDAAAGHAKLSAIASGLWARRRLSTLSLHAEKH